MGRGHRVAACHQAEEGLNYEPAAAGTGNGEHASGGASQTDSVRADGVRRARVVWPEAAVLLAPAGSPNSGPSVLPSNRPGPRALLSPPPCLR